MIRWAAEPWPVGRYATQEHDTVRDRAAEERDKRADEDERWYERARDGWQRSGVGEEN